ncbi:MAG: hypothetical protein HYX94_01895 [Chloroflexi bacterium]|nr:hypothetical protein [Chloroflexota bacterium]
MLRGTVTIVVRLMAAILLFGSIVWVLVERGLLPSSTGASDGPAPVSIAGYRLQQTVTGPAALDEVAGMHGKDVELRSAWIGRYQASGTVWYGEVATEAKAAELIARMSAKIGAGNQVFTNLQQVQYQGTTVYSVVGLGQQHFFYKVGSKTIWLAAPKGGEQAFLQDAMRILK